MDSLRGKHVVVTGGMGFIGALGCNRCTPLFAMRLDADRCPAVLTVRAIMERQFDGKTLSSLIHGANGVFFDVSWMCSR